MLMGHDRHEASRSKTKSRDRVEESRECHRRATLSCEVRRGTCRAEEAGDIEEKGEERQRGREREKHPSTGPRVPGLPRDLTLTENQKWKRKDEPLAKTIPEYSSLESPASLENLGSPESLKNFENLGSLESPESLKNLESLEGLGSPESLESLGSLDNPASLEFLKVLKVLKVCLENLGSPESPASLECTSCKSCNSWIPGDTPLTNKTSEQEPGIKKINMDRADELCEKIKILEDKEEGLTLSSRCFVNFQPFAPRLGSPSHKFREA
ncbi:hypothetical protein WH47_00912 [Habropoda laboriosa]|uniref:Uncharacterized protein n=1 Tax=Habropoda laboriosa TaxID=597456 RepID=A0A0L7RJV2_9HYME|nr:hypothetical protein WH47_00912 [Habropoda laboriosa]